MKNKKFFESIVNLISDIIWEVDENWRYTYISGKLEESLGFTAEELIGRTPFSLMTYDEAERMINLFDNITLERRSITGIEINILNKKNETRYLLISGVPVLDKDGTLKGYRGIVRDITDKKLVELALLESEMHLSTLMDNLPGMAYRGSFKSGFTLEAVSAGVYPLTGYNSSDFIEKRLTFQSIIHPDDLNIVNTIILKALNIKKHYEVIFRIFTPDSKIKWILDKGIGIYNDDKLIGLEGFCFDITETREAIEYGRINERRFRNLFESNPQGIAVGNKDGFIIQTNKIWKKMFGYPDDYSSPIHISDIRIGSDRDRDMFLFKSLFSGINENYRIERLFKKRDGTDFWCELTVSLTGDPDEQGFYAIGLYIDITERKKIEQELKCFHEELENLVQERTGEINRLTQKVINSQEEERQRIASDLHDGVGQTILAAKYAFNSFIKSSSMDDRLLERGKALIDIASQELREIYTGIYPSMLKELGLNATIHWFIRNSLEVSGFKVKYTNTLNTDIDPNLSLNIYRIIQELFNNILKHSRADSVNISLNPDREFIVIEVSDNGKGFDIENKRKTTTGAGLINVRKRVEFLKGNLHIESMPGGTCFRMEIPMEQK